MFLPPFCTLLMMFFKVSCSVTGPISTFFMPFWIKWIVSMTSDWITFVVYTVFQQDEQSSWILNRSECGWAVCLWAHDCDIIPVKISELDRQNLNWASRPSLSLIGYMHKVSIHKGCICLSASCIVFGVIETFQTFLLHLKQGFSCVSLRTEWRW